MSPLRAILLGLVGCVLGLVVYVFLIVGIMTALVPIAGPGNRGTTLVFLGVTLLAAAALAVLFTRPARSLSPDLRAILFGMVFVILGGLSVCDFLVSTTWHQ